jgi:hypothetical protein
MANDTSDKKQFFDQIDEYFYSKKSSEVSVLYMATALVIGFLVYQFVFLQTDKDLRTTENKLRQIKQKVSNERNYLSENTVATLNEKKEIVKSKYERLDNILYKMSYVDNTLTELSYLLFDDNSWAGFVDHISKLAKKYDVSIKEIGSKFYEPSFKEITHVVEVDVKSKAKFKNMVKFLNAIEESQLVVDVNDINMSNPDGKVDGVFKIAVWGMKYE